MTPHGLSIDVADLMTRLSAPAAAGSDRCVSASGNAGLLEDPGPVEYGCVRLAGEPGEDDELDDDELEDEEDDEDEEEDEEDEEEESDEEDNDGWEDDDEEDEYDDEDEDEEDEDEPMQASR